MNWDPQEITGDRHRLRDGDRHTKSRIDADRGVRRRIISSTSEYYTCINFYETNAPKGKCTYAYADQDIVT